VIDMQGSGVLGTRKLVLASGLVTALSLPWPSILGASTVYRVDLNTSQFQGTPRSLALDWVSPSAPSNLAKVARFTTDGRRGQSSFFGGPVSGGLVDVFGALEATIRDSAFLNQLVIPIDSLGTRVTFDIGTSENSPVGNGAPDELSFYILDADDGFAFPTLDPLGAN
jgi:hypothetical protein